ncbi:hypothetical protein [Gordonia amicalis]|uniref:hypothetical protein n=1 Tax=Gordonia amicalis TaxID=89053 RepID=UPI0024BB653C|nr:hypothetical protein [Gordonia amicalis]MDJ0454089.1 hypothetical protein [Gordonia amicalis]MDV7077233.1 hypothetical protein [Gordonia amicalis]
MTDTNAPAVIDASDLTLLVSDTPDARAYQANPIDLSDPVEARETLAALRDEGEIVVVGIECDDPDEPGNRIVVTGLDAVRLVDVAGQPIDVVQLLVRVDDLECVHLTAH